MTTTFTINTNSRFNSLEITFNQKPSAAVRDVLKSMKFRWNPTKGIWYGFADQAALEKSLSPLASAEDSKTEKKSAAATRKTETVKEEKNDHNLKVGDVLVSSWGYEQTNVDFFVVVKTTKTSVYVKEAVLAVVEESAHTGMSCERSYDPASATPTSSSHWIKNQDTTGDRFKVHNYDRNNAPRYDAINLTSYASAHRYQGEKMYESWYY